MALPTLSKTWQFNVNNVIGPQYDTKQCYDLMWITIKNALKGFGTNPWAVKGSCNSSAAGMDNVDRWSTVSDIVHATGAHSWIVLAQTGLGGTMPSICIDMVSATVGTGTIVVSPVAGFTGGTTTARPTATDEVVMVSNASMVAAVATPATFQSVVHVMQDTTGQNTRVIVMSGGTNVLFWAFEKLGDTHANFTNNYSFTIANGATDAATRTNLYAATKTQFRFGSANYAAYWTDEAYNAIALGNGLNQVPNEISGGWSMGQIGMLSIAAGARGRHGRYPDMYWGSAFHSNGVCFPNDTSRLWAVFGNVIVPWNGTVPVIA